MTTPIGAAGGSQATGTAATGSVGRSTIAQNFDAFLLLLTTQLKNQSPLDPLDTNQFTQQLVQFASVEQQLKSNETLNALLATTRAANVSTAASFVGMQVTADGATAPLSDGKAEWRLNVPRDAAQASVTIRDRSGSAIATKTLTLASGSQTFTWDGRTSTGSLAPEGDYTITVTARDVSGQAVSVKTEISGRVDGIDLSGDGPVLLVGSARVPLASVKSITRQTGAP